MKTKIISGLLCVLLSSSLGSTPAPGADRTRDTALDEAIVTLMEEYHIPGLAMASFYRDPNDPDVPVMHRMETYGYAQLEGSIPVEEWTTFMIASASKVVSSASMLQVWEDHGFSLDADVNGFVDFPVVHPTCPDSAVTFRKIFTHTASLMRNQNATGAPAGMPICDGLAEYFSPDGQYYNPDTWEPLCPGRAYVYSNLGPTLLACLAGTIGGLPFPEYSRTYLFDPLGMDDTVWFGDEVDHESAAYSYSWNAGDFYLVSPGGHDVFVYPAWSLRTSVRDLARFAMAFMMGGELDGVRILEEATIDEAWTVQYADIEREIGLMWEHWLSSSTGDWVWGHLGSSDHYAAAIVIQEDHEYGFVMMGNGGGSGWTSGMIEIAGVVALDVHDVILAAPSADRPHIAVVSNFPNPCNPSTTIRYRVPVAGPARLEVFDLRGRRVAVLLEGTVAAGPHEVAWDGRSSDGRVAPTGIYLSRLEAGGQVAHGRMTLIR